MTKKTISIRLPEELHKKIQELAQKDHRTVSAFIEMLIIEKINQIQPIPAEELNVSAIDGIGKLKYC